MDPTKLQRTPSRTLTHLPRKSMSPGNPALVARLPESCDNDNDNEAAYCLQLDQQQASRQSGKPPVCEEECIATLSSRSILVDWWEELISAIIGLICTILAISILLYMDSRSMHDWKLPIQPNSLVALLATLTRAALVHPLAECIGHLKWTFFEKPRTLDFMHTFDIATRGPLGASKFLWKTQIRSPVASCAALVTVILLFFQPFMQQAIEVSSRIAPILNETASVSHTYIWSLRPDTDLKNPNQKFWPALSDGLYKAVTNGARSDPINAYCPTSTCNFPDFEALSICSKCEDHAINLNLLRDFDNCTLSTNLTGTTLQQPDFEDLRREIQERRLKEPFHANLICTREHLTIELAILNEFLGGIPIPETTIWLQPFALSGDQSGDRPSSAYLWDGVKRLSAPPSYQNSERANFKVCNNVVASFDEPNYSRYNQILDSSCFDSKTELWRYTYGDEMTTNFGDVNGTLTTCALTPCVKQYTEAKVKDDKVSAKITGTVLKFYNATIQPDEKNIGDGWGSDWIRSARLLYCTGEDENCSFTWSMYAMEGLGEWMRDIMGTGEFAQFLSAESSGFEQNFTLLYQRIAEEVTVIMQSSANPNATNITGTAYGTDLYVQVHWVWLVLPVATVVISIMILGFVIFESKKKPYLFKNKILAALVFELSGWRKEEYGADRFWERQTMRKLEESSMRMKARMQLPDSAEEGLKLKKE